jgi:diacylglycerol O-acyltransferase
MDAGTVPSQLGVILVLDGSIALPRAQQLLAERIRAVPRLRQNLVRTPLGCGGPIWAHARR